MENIVGKVLVTTDWHIGLKQNSKSRLNIIVKAVKKMIEHIKANDIKTLVFCGDLFHERVSVNVNSMNVALHCIQAIAKHCKTYLIVGNHDSHLKNSIDINSLNMFKTMPNVEVIDKVTEVSINGNKSVLVPWIGDMTAYEKETFDMMFGHFDVSHKYLIKSYIEEHSTNLSSDATEDELSFDNNNLAKTSTVGDYVGDFVEYVKRGGTVFSGHIHSPKSFMSRSRRFILIGDPYQQNLGEKDYECGFYTIQADNSYSFTKLDGIPKHIDLKIGSIMKDGIDNFDFSVVKDNIIHKIYDIDILPTDDAKISQKINDMHPYEELLPDYEVELSFSSDMKIQNESIELIKKSKLEYVRNYISNIDQKALDEQGIDKDKLFSVIEQHYNKVVVEK